MKAPSNSTDIVVSLPLSSKWLLAMLDHRRHIDYLFCALLGGLPSLFTWHIGVLHDLTDKGRVYLGLLDKPNMWPQVVFIIIST